MGFVNANLQAVIMAIFGGVVGKKALLPLVYKRIFLLILV